MNARWARRRAIFMAVAVLLGAVLPGTPRLGAQTSRLTLSTATLTFPTSATVADYDSGFVCATGPITATVAATAGGNRTDQLYIRALAQFSGGASQKSLGDFQWTLSASCASTSTWTSLTTSPVAVGASGTIRNGQSFSRTVYFRVKLVWSTDLGNYTITVPQIQFLMNVPNPLPTP